MAKLAHTSLWIGLGILLCIAFWIRIQGVTHLPDEQFTGADPYLYYWQAQTIAENGHLPARDMHRWVPLGRDLGQTLNLYSYALAYTHKAVATVFANISLYQVCLYMPVICFCIALVSLCLFLYHTHGCLFSSIVGVLLATLPSSIERSAAGFGDRDAWCLMLGILAVVTYLAALQTETSRKRLIWTLTSGFIVFLGGISWEGFGVFLSVIIVVEICRYLAAATEDGLGFYLLWVLCFVPTLYLASPAYRSGYGFAEHLAAFVLVPPIVLLGIRGIRYFLLSKVERLRPHARTLSLGLTLACGTLAIGYVLIQHPTFAATTVPLSQTPLMQTIGELHAPDLKYWVFRYGSLFIIGSLGLLTTLYPLRKRHGTVLAILFALFCLTTFFRVPLDKLFGVRLGNILFGLTTASSAVGLCVVAWFRKAKSPHGDLFSATGAWFIVWVALSRDALRYDFFLGVPLAFFTAALIQSLANTISRKLRHSKYTTDVFRKDIQHAPLKTCAAGALLALLMFCPPVAYTQRSLFAARGLRPAIPGNTLLLQAFHWMKKELPETAIVAASTGYGTQLNVRAGVKTITDPDHFIPHWIHLYARHVSSSTDEKETLAFLKTHGTTHLLLTEKDLRHNATYAFIGGYENAKQFKPHPLHVTSKRGGGEQRLTGLKQTPFAALTFNAAAPQVLTARLRTGELVKLPAVTYLGDRQEKKLSEHTEIPYGGTVLYFDEHQHLEKAYYLPSCAWKSIAGRLYFQGDFPDIFVPVYPTTNFENSMVKVWKLHYPSDIHPDVKYLKTGIPEIDQDLPLQ